ncbi:UPF0223 family protein [Apilactobacillus apisilvae]|uniref:UPF0223 family protein n=1 Tax=Apilactobacillus apisilvae TaxID=2923364 RepID=A0ABY4PIU4_9LACO|nr:UPF0223 family protein [Apilactobacillus apisilvae]UQS85522.1 UPF0223 family protein [Apilactobacillus apisilvae]
MSQNYSYPIFESWNRNEIISMMSLYNSVEKAYEDNNGINKDQIIELYKHFQSINPSKMEQKQIDSNFFNISGYSIYKTFKAATNNKSKNVRMNK